MLFRPFSFVKKAPVFILLSFILFSLINTFPYLVWSQSQLLNPLQSKKEVPEEKPLSVGEQVAKFQEQTQKDLEDIRKSLEGMGTDLESSKLEIRILKNKENKLEELQLFYEQIQEELKRQKELQGEIETQQKKLDVWKQSPPNASPAPSFEAWDQLNDQLYLLNNSIQASENTATTLNTSLEEAKKDAENTDRERRSTKEKLELNTDPALRPGLEFSWNNLEIESRIARARVLLMQQEAITQKSQRALWDLQKELLVKKTEQLREKAKFSENDFQKKVGQLEEEKNATGQSLRKARQELQNFEKSIVGREESESEKEYLRSQRKALQDNINILVQRLQRTDEVVQTWRRRYMLFNDRERPERLQTWKQETQQKLDRLRRDEGLAMARLAEIQKDLDKTREALEGSNVLAPELRPAVLSQREELLKLNGAYQTYLTALARESRLYNKLLEELDQKSKHITWGQRFSDLWTRIEKVWNFELTSIDDKPITVSKLIWVLVLLIVGFRFSRKLSVWMGQKLFPRLGFASGVSAGLQTISFYLLVLLVTLLVLYIVNVPLTLFTVLGGALAIGVGFGSQNIVRNFISGLILLAERPIKIGDTVEIDGSSGIIENVGARSTRIRTFNNSYVILPNSDLLEKKVLNWTFTDSPTRVMIQVGASYESSPRQVAKLLRRAVDEHGKIMTSPEPSILFKAFGDHALIFEVYFWVKMRHFNERESILSDIRFRIDTLFREEGIAFASSQKGALGSSNKPLEVRLLNDSPSQEEKKPLTEPNAPPSGGGSAR